MLRRPSVASGFEQRVDEPDLAGEVLDHGEVGCGEGLLSGAVDGEGTTNAVSQDDWLADHGSELLRARRRHVADAVRKVQPCDVRTVSLLAHKDRSVHDALVVPEGSDVELP